MKTLAVLFILLLVLICIGSATDSSDAIQVSDKSDSLGSAVTELSSSTTSLFVAMNDIAYEIDAHAHEASRFVRAIWGLSECVIGVLALIGLVALSTARRASRRFLS